MNLSSPWSVQIAMLTVRRGCVPETTYNAGRDAAIKAALKTRDSNRKRIIALLKKNPMRINEIVCALHLCRETVRNHLASLERDRIVEHRSPRGPWRLACR